ncbi:hypothetical protein ACET3Z_027882 [Daucus carota]
MALPLLFLLMFSSISVSQSHRHLSLDHYAKTCPDFDRIMQEVVTPKQISNPTTAAATLRVFFHDCMVDGCDGSILIDPGTSNNTERSQEINHSLSGDAFDVVVRAKTALELACPNVVSCSDILATATRNLIKQVGGPYYPVLLGRKDSFVSMSSHVEHGLTRTNSSMDRMIAIFAQKGFTVREMVALLGGGHTIGFVHCSEFASRIFNFSATSEVDPSLNPNFANRLRTLCANYKTSPDMAAFMDPISPGKFDNNLYQNLMRGLDVLPSDHLLITDPRTRTLVAEYARDQNLFFTDFARAMEKVSVTGVKTGRRGEIRTNCNAFNTKA